MQNDEPAEHGSLVIAALLILAIAFAGSWILAYVRPGTNPWSIVPWFGIAAAIIVLLGIVTDVLPRRRRKGR